MNSNLLITSLILILIGIGLVNALFGLAGLGITLISFGFFLLITGPRKKEEKKNLD